MYFVCRRCAEGGHPADERLGLVGTRTLEAERLLTLAGGSWSFDRASHLLREFCGISVSDNTIRSVCQSRASSMADWQHTQPAAHEKFRESGGLCEFETDGTSVNTTQGWREMRLAMFAKRNAAAAAEPAEWAKRPLPKPTVITAFAAIEKGERFVRRWGRWLSRLGIGRQESVHVVADGAPWIWQGVRGHLREADGVLDIYHALEHIGEASRVLNGDGTSEAATWRDEARDRLLSEGWAGIDDWLQRQLKATRRRTSRQALENLWGYLGRRRGELDYRRQLATGRTIGSGMVEGGCKHIIGRRLKQTGARWRPRRVNRMATLCCTLQTQQWDAYWNYTPI